MKLLKALVAVAGVMLTAAPVVAVAQPRHGWQVDTADSLNANYTPPGVTDATVFLVCAGRGALKLEAVIDSAHYPIVRRGNLAFHPDGSEGARPARAVVQSGNARAALNGEVSVDPGYRGGYVTVDLPSGAAITRGVRQTGAIRFTSFGQTVAPPAVPAPMLLSFLARCRSSQ